MHNISAAEAWANILSWLDAYDEEEKSFSRYRDDVILDGVMTAAQRRAVSAIFPRQSRIATREPEMCPNCGQSVPLLHPCTEEECPIPGSY